MPEIDDAAVLNWFAGLIGRMQIWLYFIIFMQELTFSFTKGPGIFQLIACGILLIYALKICV